MTTVSDNEGFALSVLNAARENPVSTALIGVGALWMFMGGNRVSALGQALDAGREAAIGVGTSIAGAATTVQRQAGDAGSAAMESARHAGSAAATVLSDTAASFRTGIGNAADDPSAVLGGTPRSDAGRASRSINDGVRDVVNPLQGSLADLWDRQPLLLGGVGLLVGAGLASMLPRTDFEDDLIGEAGDAVKAQARGLLNAQASRAQKVAEAVKTEANAQGLTIEGVMNVTGAIVGQATDAAKSAGPEIGGRVSPVR